MKLVENFYHKLTFVKDLAYFDGPLHSRYHDENGQLYDYWWFDCDEDSNSWLLFQLTQEWAGKYENKELTSLEFLVDNPGNKWIVKTYRKLIETYECTIDDFPVKSRPNPGVYHSPEES